MPMVTVKDKESGKIMSLHPVDAFEQAKLGIVEVLQVNPADDKDKNEKKKAKIIKKALNGALAQAPSDDGEDVEESEDDAPKPVKTKKKSKRTKKN